ncbi:MAG TPA: cation:proton antiporter, partial [Pyrinomonadaceae bacterium]
MPARPRFTFLDLRHYLPYFLLLVIFVVGVWLILTAGSRLQPATLATPALQAPSSNVLWENFRTPLSILLTQIIVILTMAGLFRRLFRRIHQPPVMGEMVAGIVLGPSVLGLIYPPALTFLFPASSLEILRQLSQIGVVLFMFIVGTELNLRYVREKGSAAVMISHAS